MRAAETKTTRAWSARGARARSAFRDRADAGRQLAGRLLGFTAREDCVVLARPPGGVPVAYEIARKLRLPLDVLVAGKLVAPGHPDQAIGVLASDHGAVLDEDLIRAARLTEDQVAAALEGARTELRAAAQVYREARKPLDLTGKAVLLVDDGAEGGAALLAAVRALKRLRPSQVIVAAPVCPVGASALLEREADLLLALRRPTGFYAVRDFYVSFRPVSEEAVLQLLDASERGFRKRPRNPRAGARIPGAAS